MGPWERAVLWGHGRGQFYGAMGEGRSIGPQAYLISFIVLDNPLKYTNKVLCQQPDIIHNFKRRVNTKWTDDRGSGQSGNKEGRKVGRDSGG